MVGSLSDHGGSSRCTYRVGARPRTRARPNAQLLQVPRPFQSLVCSICHRDIHPASDLVFDNHVGGGTTLVEALALGRDAIGIDISPLAEFLATGARASSHLTRRWSKTDSNPRSPPPRRGQHFRGGSELYPLPINHRIGDRASGDKRLSRERRNRCQLLRSLH